MVERSRYIACLHHDTPSVSTADEPNVATKPDKPLTASPCPSSSLALAAASFSSSGREPLSPPGHTMRVACLAPWILAICGAAPVDHADHTLEGKSTGESPFRDAILNSAKESPDNAFGLFGDDGEVESTFNRFRYNHGRGYCIRPPNSGYRLCRFRQKEGGPQNLDQCYSLANFFDTIAVEACEYWGPAPSLPGQTYVPNVPSETEQFCTLYLPWHTTCVQYMNRTTHSLGIDMHPIKYGLYDSVCNECGQFMNSPSTGFSSRRASDSTWGSHSSINSVAVAQNMTNWMCAWGRTMPPPAPPVPPPRPPSAPPPNPPQVPSPEPTEAPMPTYS